MFLRKINPYIPTFLFFITLLLLPFFFEFLPFYGDDSHFINDVINGRGVVGSWYNWSNTYGVIYRPIGYFIQIHIYQILIDYREVFYIVNLSLYLIAAFQVRHLISKIFKITWMADFVAFTFLLFPLNATAYWQIPSISAIMGLNLFLIFLFLWHKSFEIRSKKYLLSAFLIWILLAFIYEQSLSLAPAPLLLICIFYYTGDYIISLKKVCIISMIFIITTFSIIGLFLLNPKNPKINSLYATNVEKNETLILDKSIENKAHIEKSKVQKLLDRSKIQFQSLQKRSLKTVDYFNKSFIYVLPYLFQKIIFTSILIILLFVYIFKFLNKNYEDVPNKISLIAILVGSIWFAGALLPFSVYKEFSIPPYAFVSPSIGISITSFGIISFFIKIIRGVFKKIILNISIVLLISFMFIQHLSYYLSLQEEFRYWEKIVSMKEFSIEKLSKNSVIVINNPPQKENTHVFWLEKSIGLRYLQLLISGFHLNANYNHFSSPIVSKVKNQLIIKSRIIK